MQYQYQTENTCSQLITFDLNDGCVTNLQFLGGCNGNLKSIALLVDGWKAQDIIDKLSGVTCGRRPTSCGDQLAKALVQALEAEKTA